MTPPEPSPPDPPAPDFDRGLFVADRPGPEFTSVGSSAWMASFIPAQGGVGSFAIGLVGGWVLAGWLGVAGPARSAVALVAGLAVMAAAIIALVRLGGYAKANAHAYAAYNRSSDSRYRVRAIIPKKRAPNAIHRWLAEAGARPDEPPTPEDLGYTAGGFEPLIARVWFGVSRGGRYHRLVALFAVAAALLGWPVLGVTWASIVGLPGFGGMGWYAIVALLLVGSFGAAELSMPVYLRLVPGRLDVFEFPPLGAGPPAVTTYDLARAGVCVDFGHHLVALEKPRPPGTPAPELVLAKRWPYHKTHAPGERPDYLALGLTPGRSELMRRIVQAARTTEPAPDLPADRLLG
ncbi:MAG: hypothetical protein RIB60_02375 [Phycisphaerales bacterium]